MMRASSRERWAPGAEMAPEAEREMGTAQEIEVAVETERVGIIEDLGITIGRSVGCHRLGRLGDRDSMELEFSSVRPVQPEYRSIEAQALLHGDRVEVGTVTKFVVQLGTFEDPPEQVS